VPEFLVPDPFSAFFLICFFLGVVFVLLSAVMGATQDLGHFPGLHHGVGNGGDAAAAGHSGQVGHVGDVGHAGDVGHGHSEAGSVYAHASNAQPVASASPLNLMTVMAFLTWFGGAGYILYTVFGIFLPLSLLAAVAAGALAGWLVYMFLVKVLLPGTTAGDLRAQSLIGTVAHVSIPIPEGRVGEIVYTLEGARHSDGAKAVDGRALERDKEVVIIRYERGIAYVQEWERFLDEVEGMPASRNGLPAGPPGQQSAGSADSERG
jgi:membrane protein implicated in regulation of membrane protease activity